MKHWTRILIIGCSALALSFAACGDDDKDDNDTTTTTDTSTTTTTDTSTTTDAATETSNPDTVADTEDAIEEVTPPPVDACINAADQAVITAANPDPADIASACGSPGGAGCFESDFANKDNFQACVADCVENGLGETPASGLSADCSICYAITVRCAGEKCLQPCGFGSAEDCATCRDDMGCTDLFNECAGTPSE